MERGWFTPDEDECVRQRFAQYLTARAALLQTIAELDPIALPEKGAKVDSDVQLRAFVIGYTATCLLVRAANAIVDQLAAHKVVQRKLNEAEPNFGIPRKQYTAIYKSLTSPTNALRIRHVRTMAGELRDEIESLANDPVMGSVVEILRECESCVHRRKRDFVLAHLRYRWHSYRRRRASAIQQALFALFEFGGRIVADIRYPHERNRVDDNIRSEIELFLQPGDVIVSRHDDQLSNLFLPGFWPHSSLHLGKSAARQTLQVEVDAEHNAKLIDPLCVLEARKDGVLFRPLTDTLAVDAVLVLRPMCDQPTIAQAIKRAIRHEGKLYDFEFDFFRSDRMVCTEVVYRAYHGLGGIEFQLSERAGRPTLTAEDIVTLGVEKRGFQPVLLYGVDEKDTRIYTGDDAARKLESQRSASASGST